MTHEAIREAIWTNPGEVPDNGRDDDGNGFIDDAHGWDLGDGNADPSPPTDRLADFYHGTHLGGIIMDVLREAYGQSAFDHVRLMPVKCLPDDSVHMILEDGYAGIQYAVENGADIILCAWSLAIISDEEKAILDTAIDSGALVIASSGNLNEDRPQYPAAYPGVLAVSAHDRLGIKLDKASYGGFVDLIAPGEEIIGAASTADSGTVSHSGTSPAAAIVSAAAAIVKLQHPDYTAAQIRASLVNSTTTTTQNAPWPARLGSGKLNIGAAVTSGDQVDQQQLLKPNGYLPVQTGRRGSWQIGPLGQVAAIHLRLAEPIPDKAGGRLIVKDLSTLEADPRERTLESMRSGLQFEGNHLSVSFDPEPGAPDNRILLAYDSIPERILNLYCGDPLTIASGSLIEDGSGEEPYAPGSDCKWHIKAPPGKVIRIQFLEFDTEPHVDKLYFFNGPKTNAPIMAIYSGTELPPDLISWTNEVLLWFVSDVRGQGAGWKASVEFIDPNSTE